MHQWILFTALAACSTTSISSLRQDARSGEEVDANRASEADASSLPSVLRVAVISDLNGSYGATTYRSSVSDAVDQILSLSPDLVIATGDLVAGQRADLNYPAMWAGFHGAVSDRLVEHQLAFAVTPGNHDASGYSSYAEERALFVSEWQSRKPALNFLSDEHYPLRYSFKVQDALFVSLDATVVGPLDSEQMTWLANELARPASLKIVYGHLSQHAFAVGRETQVIGDPAFEALLEESEVDLYISGHQHAYYPGKVDAVRYLSMACLGSGPRSLVGTETRSPRSFVVLELQGDRIVSLEAMGGTDFQTPILRSTLPEALGPVIRDDL